MALPSALTRSLLAGLLAGALALPSASTAAAETPQLFRYWPVERGRDIRGSYDPVIGDFNGDGFEDVFWYAPGTAPEHLWLGGGGPMMGAFTDATSVQPVTGTYTPIVGDFDGDEADDIYWDQFGVGGADSLWVGGVGRTRPVAIRSVRSLPGEAVTLRSTVSKDALAWVEHRGARVRFEETVGSGQSISHVYPSRAQVIVGDFDGNGRDDLFAYTPGTTSEGTYRWLAAGSFNLNFDTVNGTYAPVAADLNGDGADDLYFGSAASLPHEGARTSVPVWMGRPDLAFDPTWWTSTMGQPLAVRSHDGGLDAVAVHNVMETTIVRDRQARVTHNAPFWQGEVLVGRFTDGAHDDVLVYRWGSRPTPSCLYIAPARA